MQDRLERLERLERDLSMLQRQVYRGSGTPAIAGGHSAAVDAELRMDRLEAEMRDLTGRVENAVNGVEQLRRRLEQINGDIDVRLGQGQGPSATTSRPTVGSSGAGTSPLRAAPPTMNQTASTQPTPPLPPGTVVPPPYTPTGLGTLTPPGSPQRPAQAALEPTAPPGAGTPRGASSGSLPSGATSDQYNFAIGLLKQADFPGAEESLKSFIQQHPNDALASNAQFYLGETYYQRERFADAASAYAEGYKRYPKGAKAADNLYKLGLSLSRQNQKQNACLAFTQLDHDFPNPGNTIKERAAAEKKRLGC
jgi:tol-pal system protein YbgF